MSSAPNTNRIGRIERNTRETEIALTLNLDGTGQADVHTGLPFFDHLLENFARHGLFDLEVKAKGDLEVDPHHTVEDVGLCLGRALVEAIGDRAGIFRIGECTRPFDEALISAYVDVCGRPAFVYRVDVLPGRIGSFDVELGEVFFQALANDGRMNLHLVLQYGHNRHHILEGATKALAVALRAAVKKDPARAGVASTKGVLD